MSGILFFSAGRIDWLAAWLLLVYYALYLLFFRIWGFIHAPELLHKRCRLAANVKCWDKIINIIYPILIVILLIIAGLDSGRYRWLKIPPFVQVIGMIGLLFACWFILCTITENAYASHWARIQEDCKQKVITSGSYQYIRHLMYAAIILLVFFIPLELGSW